MPLAKKGSSPTPVKSGRVAVIVSPKHVNWGSCQVISPNLRHAYEIAEKKMGRKFTFDYIDYGDQLSKEELWKIAQKIVRNKYSHVSFIDHWPPAFGLVRALMSLTKGKNLPTFLFHVYGDFTFHATDLVSTFYLLRDQKVRPVCASHRQINLVHRLIHADKKSVGYVPFPVNTKIYFPSEKIRREQRRALGWGDDEFIMLYTGRISMQKNVTTAISQFFAHIKKTGAHKSKMKYRLVLAGKYDDLGAPFFGKCPPKGDYFFRVRAAIESVDPELGHVSHIGNFEPEALNRIYNAADGFLSLSLHHDEDYGMAPAEALATGLPCVLSDWGGYSSFEAINAPARKMVWLVPVGVDSQGLYLMEPAMNSGLAGVLNSKTKISERQAAARRFHNLFSIESAAERIADEIQEASTSSVRGPSQSFVDLAKRAIQIREGQSSQIYNSYDDSLYLDIYSAYRGME